MPLRIEVYRAYWRYSAVFSQAFYLGKKLQQALALPETSLLRLSPPGSKDPAPLSNYPTYQALGIRLMDVQTEAKRPTEFKFYGYRLVPHDGIKEAILERILPIFKSIETIAEHYGGTLDFGSTETDSRILFQLSHEPNRSAIFSVPGVHLTFWGGPTRFQSLPYNWFVDIGGISRVGSFITRKAYEWRSHPLERIKAFFWIRKNHDLVSRLWSGTAG